MAPAQQSSYYNKCLMCALALLWYHLDDCMLGRHKSEAVKALGAHRYQLAGDSGGVRVGSFRCCTETQSHLYTFPHPVSFPHVLSLTNVVSLCLLKLLCSLAAFPDLPTPPWEHRSINWPRCGYGGRVWGAVVLAIGIFSHLFKNIYI